MLGTRGVDYDENSLATSRYYGVRRRGGAPKLTRMVSRHCCRASSSGAEDVDYDENCLATLLSRALGGYPVFKQTAVAPCKKFPCRVQGASIE